MSATPENMPTPEDMPAPQTPPESSLGRELLAILVLYLALTILPILFGLFFLA